MHSFAVLEHHFTGFPRHGLWLLRQLSEHNNRAWFAPRREAFRALLVAPALDLVIELGPLLRSRVSDGIRAEPRVGGSILRQDRDARFAREAPLRTHIELWFWEGSGPSHVNPGCFVRLSPERLVLGAGLRRFPDGVLQSYRRAVDAPASGRELVAAVRRLEHRGWRLEASRRRRVPEPYARDHERAGLLSRDGLIVERSEALPDAVFRADLPLLLASELRRVRGLHRWLVRVCRP
jgi:uncharacterized protein (TIGR02453 family)